MNLFVGSLLLLFLPALIPVERETISMGTRFRTLVYAPSHRDGVEATERILVAVDSVDQLLSTWHPSALDSLNRAPVGRRTEIPAALAPLLAEVLAWEDSTDHDFETVSGSLTDAWQLRGSGEYPSASRLATALSATGSRGFRFDRGVREATRLNACAWMDSGGFGKGAALRAARTALRQAGVTTAELDFGGQLLLLGAPAPRMAWPVAIADPRDRSRRALQLQVRDASVATSSQSERFVSISGTRFGHLLDPRSGRPVPAWGSATVIASDPLVADILSTALFVMGPEQAMRWAERHPAIGVVLLLPTSHGLEVQSSAGARPYLVPSSMP